MAHAAPKNYADKKPWLIDMELKPQVFMMYSIIIKSSEPLNLVVRMVDSRLSPQYSFIPFARPFLSKDFPISFPCTIIGFFRFMLGPMTSTFRSADLRLKQDTAKDYLARWEVCHSALLLGSSRWRNFELISDFYRYDPNFLMRIRY